MMGAYFAVTGLGNKVAGLIGENASKLVNFGPLQDCNFLHSFWCFILVVIKPLKD